MASSLPDTSLPTIQDIMDAHTRIKPHVHLTPILSSASLTQMTSHQQLLFKCENLQRTGSFKIRGATNAILSFLEEERSRGAGEADVKGSRVFVTHSSGNHGQALACACQQSKCEAHIIVPKNAPQVKINAMKGYGGHIHFCEPTLAAREALGKQVLAAHNGSTFVHPYNNVSVMAGQGTAGVEIIQQCGTDVDAVVIPVGGGGLLGGMAIAIKALSPNTKVFGAEPLGADDASRSFSTGVVQLHSAGNPNTIADGLLTTLCPRTLKAIKANVDGIITVSEKEIAAAMRLVYDRLKTVIEPSAATGVAVVLAKHRELMGCRKVVVLLCGGNVELDRFPHYLALAKL